MRAFHSHPPQGPWLALATSWVFHRPKLSRSPTSPTLLLEVWGMVPSCSLLNFWLAPGGSRWLLVPISVGPPNWHLQWPLHLLQILNPLGRLVLKVGSMAVLWLHLAAPPLPWAHASDWLLMRGWLSHSISSSKVATVVRAFWWASLTSARLLSTEAPLSPLLGVLLLEGQTSAGLSFPVICDVLPLSCPWQSSKEATTSSTSFGSLEETLVASRVCILHNRGIWTPPYCSGALPAGWQIHPPWGPASAGHVSGLSRPYTLPPSALALRHAETSCAVSWGNGGYLPPSSLPFQE